MKNGIFRLIFLVLTGVGIATFANAFSFSPSDSGAASGGGDSGVSSAISSAESSAKSSAQSNLQSSFSTDKLNSRLSKLSAQRNKGGQQVLPYRAYATRSYYYVTVQGGRVNYLSPISDNTLSSPAGLIVHVLNNELASTWLAGLGGGYQFNTGNSIFLPGVKVGLLYDHFFNSALTGEYGISGPPLPGETYSSSVSAHSLFATTDIDLINLSGFKPFIHLGAGVAQDKVTSFTFQGPEASYLTINASNKNNFAWQAGAGIGYDILKPLNVYVEYVHTSLGSITANVSEIYDPTFSGELNYHLTNSAYIMGITLLI